MLYYDLNFIDNENFVERVRLVKEGLGLVFLIQAKQNPIPA